MSEYINFKEELFCGVYGFHSFCRWNRRRTMAFLSYTLTMQSLKLVEKILQFWTKCWWRRYLKRNYFSLHNVEFQHLKWVQYIILSRNELEIITWGMLGTFAPCLLRAQFNLNILGSTNRPISPIHIMYLDWYLAINITKVPDNTPN